VSSVAEYSLGFLAKKLFESLQISADDGIGPRLEL